MITGLCRVSLLSGRIRCYWVGSTLNGLDLLHFVGVRHVAPWAAVPAGWAEQVARGRMRSAGPSRFRPNRLGKIENPLSFFKSVF
jgi:hypothetical protein